MPVGTSGSSSSSWSTSTSGLASVSALAEQYMQEQYAWGQQQFAQNSQLTDQVVGDALNLYSSLSGMGSTLMGMYQQYFTPEYSNLVNDANNYSSQARIQQAMGAAESGVAQNFNGQRNAALADLQSFGIDPSSGRYAQLDAAERTQEAAAAAGAGFQAEQSTEATGRALRSEALQLGSVMPSQATAAYNAAGQAATEAENAKLANTQEGINAINSGVPWGQLAQQLKTSQSGSTSSGNKQQQQPQKSNSGNGNNSGNNTPMPTPSNWDPAMLSNTNASGIDAGGGGTQPGSRVISGDGGPAPADAQATPWDPGASTTPDYLNPSQNGNQDPFSAQVADSGNTWDPGSTDSGSDNGALPSDFSNMGTQNPGYDPASNPFPSEDSSNYTMSPGDTMNVGGTGQSDQSSGDTGDSSGGDQYAGDTGDSSGGDDEESAAGGGKLFAHHGAIPYSRSPSHGRHTDDVHAKLNDTGEDIRLNAGEFVIPRHTVAWKGEKYFQDLIRRSRHERGAADAHPTMKPALPRRGAIPGARRHG